MARTGKTAKKVVKKAAKKVVKKAAKPTAPELILDFTGKMTVIIDLVGWGPMEIRVNDLDIVKAVVRVLVSDRRLHDVNSYDELEGVILKALLPKD